MSYLNIKIIETKKILKIVIMQSFCTKKLIFKYEEN